MTQIEWIMMLAFGTALALSAWKLYAFIPTEPLPDDDTTPDAVAALTELMEQCILESAHDIQSLDPAQLCERMRLHPDFDAERFWRFNHNRLNRLLDAYYLNMPDLASIEAIHAHLRSKS